MSENEEKVNFSREFMTIREAAAILGVSRQAIRRYIKRGRLPAYRFGGQKKTIRIKRIDFEIFKAKSLI